MDAVHLVKEKALEKSKKRRRMKKRFDDLKEQQNIKTRKLLEHSIDNSSDGYTASSISPRNPFNN